MGYFEYEQKNNLKAAIFALGLWFAKLLLIRLFLFKLRPTPFAIKMNLHINPSFVTVSPAVIFSLVFQALENSKAWTSQENDKLMNKLKMSLREKDRTIEVSDNSRWEFVWFSDQ